MRINQGSTSFVIGSITFVLFWAAAAADSLSGASPAANNANDWPTRLKDIRRGGMTSEKLVLPLSQAWVYTTARGPLPAWTESPARHDNYHFYYDLKPRQNFDRCFDVAVVGDSVYFGSSSSGAVTCLNAAQGGKEVWTFFTDGPVRFAPQVAAGKVYFGSDDGFVYCLDAAGGTVVWSERAGPSAEKFWGNERMISVWPVRSSVLVDGADVFWTAGLFPGEGMFLCKRHAADGSGGWTQTPAKPHQGYMLATSQFVLAPSGKSSPTIYRRDNGGSMGDLRKSQRDGGSWALITPDENIWSGPTVEGQTQRFKQDGKTFVASVKDANSLVAGTLGIYYNTNSTIVRIDQHDHSPVWKKEHVYPNSLIVAGRHVFAGGMGQVAAFDAENGRQLWSAPVDGNAYGLAVAAKRLYVSTNTGSIYCFQTD